MNEPVRLALTNDEALVLFEFLSRFDDTDTLTIQDQAEKRVLSNVHGLLQKQLIEIFHPDYNLLLNAARNRLRAPVDE